jgi:hypothetical protein
MYDQISQLPSFYGIVGTWRAMGLSPRTCFRRIEMHFFSASRDGLFSWKRSPPSRTMSTSETTGETNALLNLLFLISAVSGENTRKKI